MSDTIAGAYDRWSASYDVDRNPTRDLDAVILRRASLPVSDKDVLEIGCGTGKNTEWLASQAHQVTSMDFSPAMLAKARERMRERRCGDHVTFVQHDVREPWPVSAASVDLVVGNLVLEHVEQLAPIFAEAARVLRAGGVVYVAELHPFRQWRGGQAHFTATDTGEVVHVPAFTHSVSEYVNHGIAAGLTMVHVGEWLEDDAAVGVPPRLLTVQFGKD